MEDVLGTVELRFQVVEDLPGKRLKLLDSRGKTRASAPLDGRGTLVGQIYRALIWMDPEVAVTLRKELTSSEEDTQREVLEWVFEG